MTSMAMPSLAQAAVTVAELYLALGSVCAVAFVGVGVHRVMPHAGPITVGARLMILPAAILLWPLTLRRWIAAR